MTVRGRAVAASLLVLGCVTAVAAQRGAGAGAQGARPAAPRPQQPAPQPQTPSSPLFKSSVELVQVDVVVVGPDGQAIHDLKQEDFVLRDRGKPQTVSSFQEVTHQHAVDAPGTPVLPTTLKLDVSSNQSSRADRLVILVVDDLHIYQGRTQRAKDLAKQIITQLGQQASMAVLFTSGDHSTEVTEDRSELLAAADTLKGRQSFRAPHKAVDAQGAGGGTPGQDPFGRLKKIDTAQQGSLQEFTENMDQYKTLENAAKMLGSDGARRKAFVMLSEGIAKDLSGIFGAMNASVDATPGGAAYAAGDLAATMQVPTEHYHDFQLVETMAAMQRSSVATYIIDPRGEIKAQDLALENFPDTTTGLGDGPGGFRWNDPVRQAQDGLGIFAKASGGFAVTDTNDFTSGLQQIIEDIDHYYLLGFSPSDPRGNGYRRLDVQVPGHPDWTLRFRGGYVPGPPPEPKNADPLVALSSGVMPKSDVPLRLWATAFPPRTTVGPDAKVDSVALAIEVTSPITALKEEDGKLRDDVSYELLAIDNRKSTTVARSRATARFALSASTTGTAPDQVTYQIPMSVDLAPGEYQLRVSATSLKLGAGGSVYLTVNVPDFSKNAIDVSGIAIGYSDGAHVPVGHAMTTPGLATAPQASPIVPFEPSLSREFTPADTLRIYSEISRAGASGPVKATIALIDAGDKVVSQQDRQFAAGELPVVDVTLPLTSVARGAYRLRITAADDGKHTATREIGVIVK